MQQGGFKFIMRDFIKSGGIDIVIKSEETLQKHHDLYKDAATKLLLKAQE